MPLINLQPIWTLIFSQPEFQPSPKIWIDLTLYKSAISAYIQVSVFLDSIELSILIAQPIVPSAPDTKNISFCNLRVKNKRSII